MIIGLNLYNDGSVVELACSVIVIQHC